MTRFVVYFLCFLTGVAGLTYEVIWLRLLAAALGNAAYATSAVLAAFMGGMGLGALVAGRIADRRDPLRLYGVVEVALGLTALAAPWAISATTDSVVPLLRATGPGLAGAALRFVVAAAVVLVPACLMGATVPILARFAELSSKAKGDVAGRATAVVYALNTAGAAVGCAAAGYVLLGTVGIRTTGALAAGLDLFAGLAALALGGIRRPARDQRVEVRSAATAAPPRAVALALAFTVGAVVLGLETLWTRFLRVVFGHDVHAFSSMLTALLLGLAVGAAIYRALPSWIRAAPALVPALLTLLGVTAVLSLGLAGRLYLSRGMDVLGLAASIETSRSHELGLALQGVFTSLCVGLPAVASGALLPALTDWYAPRRNDGAAGNRAGSVLAANTFGSIAGSLVTPLLLVPALGIQRSFVTLAALAAAAAWLAIASSRPPRALAWTAAWCVVLALAVSCLALPHQLPRAVLARKIGPAHLVFLDYEEGRTGTVAVVQNRLNGERQIFVNGVNEVTTRLVHDQSFKLLGHLGLLLHDEPRSAVVICLGGGISAGAAAVHDLETLDVVDLERSVVPAARRFARLNNRVLDDPRVRLVVDDGRSFLRTTETRYDAIVVDSTHPRAVDSWILYTREFYDIARSRLTEDGHLVQWLPLHGLTVDEFRIIVHTFVETFPEGSLWVNAGFEQYGQAAYALLLGPASDGVIDAEVLAHSLEDERVRRDLDPWGLFTVAEVLDCFVAGPDALRRWTGHLPINTDDLPYTQFVTRWSDASPMTAERLLEVREPVAPHLAESPDPELAEALRRRYEAQGFMLAGMLERASATCGPTCEKPPMYVAEVAEGQPYFLGLRSLYLDDPDRLLEIASGLADLGYAASAVSTLELATERERTDPRLWMNLGVARLEAGDPGGAADALRSALALNPGLALARVDLGLSLLRLNRVEEALTELREAVDLAPDLSIAHAALGFALMHGTDELTEAGAHLERALEIDPRNADARISLGRLQLQLGRDEEAVATFRVAWRLSRYNPDVLFNLGVALARTGRRAGAERALEAALRVNPDDLEAHGALRALRGLREETPPRAPAEGP